MSNSDEIMRTLLKQLALEEGVVHKAVLDVYERLHDRAQLTASECVELIVEISSQLQSTFLVLDGFDECPLDVQRAMGTHMQDLMQKARTTIKIFISGRPSVEPRLRAWVSNKIDVRDNNLTDLSFMIRKKVSLAGESPELKSIYWAGPHCRAEQVVAVLETHAQGMFKWVDLALGYLHESRYYSAMTRRLNTLPALRDLIDLYAEIWKNTMAAADEADQKAMKILIMFAMYGFRQ